MKNPISLLLPIALTFITIANAQVNNMGVTFGGTKDDRGVRVIKTPDNCLLTVGVTAIGSKNDDIFVIKTDRNGTTLWQKNFGGNEDDAGWDVEETNGGKNYLISGWSRSYSKEGDEDLLLLNISSDGFLAWSKSLPIKGDQRCWSIKKLKDGNFVLIGQSQDLISRNMNGLVIKIDNEGNIVWENKYGTEMYNRLFHCAETSAGDLLLAGITRKDSASKNNGWIVLLNKNGKEKESTSLTSFQNTTVHGLIPLSNNEIMIYGYAQTDTALDQRAIYFCMFTPKGKLRWEKVTNEKDSINHGIGAILTTSGSILLTGYTKPLYSGKWDGVIYKFSKEGTLQWKKTFGGKETDQPYSLLEITKNEFLVTGLTRSIGKGGADMWLVWLDGNGNIIR